MYVFEIFLVCVLPRSVQMWENGDQKNSEYKHFLSSIVFEI